MGVLHYCMGGITIDTYGNVIDVKGKIIEGLHAAGEVTGGVHGENRLAGNSLLECTVYGMIIGKKIPVEPNLKSVQSSLTNKNTNKESPQRGISVQELAKHSTKNDCWVAIHGYVYELTDFALEHPAGALVIYDLAGKDGTDAFQTVHSIELLDDFEEERIGYLIQ